MAAAWGGIDRGRKRNGKHLVQLKDQLLTESDSSSCA